jgi:hypothetical protein
MGDINMKIGELIEEHERIVNLLDITVKKLTKEYNIQKKELDKYYSLLEGGYDRKVAFVMNEFKRGKLRDSHGKLVVNPKQALAIALSESRRMH